MRITNIVKLINDKLAGELLSKSELIQFMDNVIDDINEQLNSCFPAFSELKPEQTDYDFFPDKYIRSVVVQGAAWYYYVTDEDGNLRYDELNPRYTFYYKEYAEKEGYTVFLDQYPYIAASTGLTSEIPSAYLSKPKDELLAMMQDPAGRQELCDAMRHGRADEECYQRLMIGASGAYPRYSGVMVADAAKMHGKSRAETILDVLLGDSLASTEIGFGMCEEEVERIMAYPRTMIGTDGLWYPGAMGAHPRAFASFPRVLGHYVRERKVMSFEEAIRRMTSMPAALYGLKNKGLIRVGMDADLCLLDPDVIIDAADFKNWNARCPGLKHVFVAGQPVVTDSVHDGRLLGRKLLKNQ